MAYDPDDPLGLGGGGDWPEGAWRNAPVWQRMVEAALARGTSANTLWDIIQMGMRGYTDEEIDDFANTQITPRVSNPTQWEFLWEQMTPEQRAAYVSRQAGGSTGGGAAPTQTQQQWLWSLMSPEQREQWLTQQAGGMSPLQQTQLQQQIEQAQRAYQLQQAQFEWQKQEAERAREEARKQRLAQWNLRPSTWPALWSMYGGDTGMPAGTEAPELEAGMELTAWEQALRNASQVPYTGPVPTRLPMGSLLKGAMEGMAAPRQSFALPAGAGVLPSAQYLSAMPGTAQEGLGAAYEAEWGIPFEDILWAVQRSLPRKSVSASSYLMPLSRR